MEHFEENISRIANSLPENANVAIQDAIWAEALFLDQKILEHTQKIKSAIVCRKTTPKIGKLLLLCAKLEEINKLLNQIRHEYNL